MEHAQEFLIALPVLLLSMVAHEYAHGYAALRQGDPTAYTLGRLTLNPLKHVDPFFTVLMPLMVFMLSGGRVIFGGAKPVPVNPRNYRRFRRGDVIVSSAGIVVNLALAVACVGGAVLVGLLAGLGGAAQPALALIQRMLFWGIWLNLLLAFFNLIPIPPLDGSHLVVHLLPRSWALAYGRLSRHGVWALVLLVMVAPRALYLLLTPAFVLQAVACAATDPFALRSFPLCTL